MDLKNPLKRNYLKKNKGKNFNFVTLFSIKKMVCLNPKDFLFAKIVNIKIRLCCIAIYTKNCIDYFHKIKNISHACDKNFYISIIKNFYFFNV